MRTIRVGKGLQGAAPRRLLVRSPCVTLLVQGGSEVRTNLAPFEDVRASRPATGHGGYLSNAFVYASSGSSATSRCSRCGRFSSGSFWTGRAAPRARNHVDALFAGTLF